MEPAGVVSGSYTSVHTYMMRLGDLNGDGSKDIVYTDENTAACRYYLNSVTIDGNFKGPFLISNFDTFGGYSLALADVDGEVDCACVSIEFFYN